MTRIDMTAWPRAEVFGFFSAVSNPFYAVTFQLDVTPLAAWAKREGCSFYYALVHLCTQALNQVEAFRYDIADGQVVMLDGRDPSFTDLHKGSEQFHIVTMPRMDDLRAFCLEARKRSEAQSAFVQAEAETSSLIYFSCLPWVELTSLTNERDFDPDDAIPRIAWGRYVPRDGRLMLGMSMEVNHRFIDGLHIGRFAQALESAISKLNEA